MDSAYHGLLIQQSLLPNTESHDAKAKPFEDTKNASNGFTEWLLNYIASTCKWL